jgi:serpin B
VFVDRRFQGDLRPAYLNLLAREYGARVSTVSFDGPAATRTINRWVAEQTRDRIRTLFEQLERDTVLVLANAVYLKAVWAQQFDRSSTRPGPFTTPGGGAVTVPVMREALQDVAYARTAEWERVTLPYLGGELAMRIVLPTRVVTDAAQLTPLLRDATASTARDRRTTVSLTLPRWDARTRLDLKPALEALGMGAAFTGTADFSGIAEGEDLFVGQARHQADVTVDEEGTEAAAATGISMRVVGAIPPGVPVRVDRPFVWAVVHEPTGTPVFAGHVVDPSPRG